MPSTTGNISLPVFSLVSNTWPADQTWPGTWFYVACKSSNMCIVFMRTTFFRRVNQI